MPINYGQHCSRVSQANVGNPSCSLGLNDLDIYSPVVCGVDSISCPGGNICEEGTQGSKSLPIVLHDLTLTKVNIMLFVSACSLPVIYDSTPAWSSYYHAWNIFTDTCDGEFELHKYYWITPDAVNGGYFTIDFGCSVIFTQFIVKNTHNSLSNDRFVNYSLSWHLN